jgi:metal-responsive CopG/Arc/MetJ family transcriptional regulator
MKNIKTAISIQKRLFDQADELARKLNVSRSRLFVLAVEEYIQRYQNQTLLDEINQAYADAPDPNEQALLAHSRKAHHRMVEGEW